MYQNKWTPRIEQICLDVLKDIQPILGLKEDKTKLSRGVGGNLTATIDRLAEEKIITSLQSYNESFIAYSEEMGKFAWKSTNPQENNDFIPIFVIDPIDGSSNAILGIPFACISIALATSESTDSVIAGWVFNIFTQDFYVAEKANGAYKNGKSIQCNQISTLQNRIIAIDFDHKKLDKTLVRPHDILFPDAGLIRMMGSCALELSLVAEGAEDVYIDFRSKLRIVDFLAGMILIQEAGGMFLTPEGQPFKCNTFAINQHYSFLAFPNSLKKVIQQRLDNYNRG